MKCNTENLRNCFAKMNSKLSWDDLKIVAAIGTAGSLAGAARKLAASHATVYRRLGRIEAEMGVRLFDRGRDGYAPTVAGEEVLALADRVGADVLAVERRLAGQDLKPSGTVRVTTTDSLYVGLLAPILASFQQEFPDISLEVAVSNRPYDLSKREADVAVRPSAAPSESLIGRQVGRIAQAVYGRAGNPAVDLDQMRWVGADEAMQYRELDRWMAKNGLAALCVHRTDSVLAMQAAARSGVGLAALPLYLGEEDPALQRLTAPVEDLATDLWVLVHNDLRTVARIKSFTGAISDAVGKALSGFSEPIE